MSDIYVVRESCSFSLNTQSCIKRLLVVQDFCLWAVWAAGPVLKKNFEQLLTAVFSCFQGQKEFKIFLKTLVSALRFT